jgi:PAS domain S-box-containing protein
MAVDHAAALRLAALLDSFDDAVVSTSLDGTIESWNRAAERLFGHLATDVIGRSIAVLAPTDHAANEELMRRVRQGERLGFFETTRIRKDGEPIEILLALSPIVAPDGEPIGISMIARDATERKRIERDVHQLAAIVDSSDDAIVSKDLNGIVTSWNRAAEQMFGYTADEIVGKSITTIIPPERLPEEEYVLSRIRKAMPLEHFETVRVRKDGSLIDISLTVSPIKASDGRIIGASKIARDISERKRLLEQLEESGRLKDEFLATLSHELRTPLNALMGYAQMMREGRIPEAGRPRALELIDRNARSLQRLVSDVLDISTIVAGKARLKLEVCDLTPTIDAAVDVVRPAMETKRLSLVREFEPGGATVLGDQDRLQQVFWNLLMNAVKFTPEGGRITIAVRKHAGIVRVSVADTGVGIAPEFLPYLFQRFRQGNARVDREHAGLGLGLALVRHFVELHGGVVSAKSPGLDQGSTFEVSLPLFAAPPSA